MKAKFNYMPGSISFAEGFLGPKGDVGYFMKFDMEKAKSIINKLIVEDNRKIEYVEAGLDGDWDCNSCVIYQNKVFEDYTVYESSQWAEPIIIVNFEDSEITESYPSWIKVEKK